jgi:glutaredoxin
MMSVSGIIYSDDDDSRTAMDPARRSVVVTLFTKEGCTLCDQVQAILQATRAKYPHSLVAVDITDPVHREEEWFERYQFDIPVLHIDGAYWTKHRLTAAEAECALAAATRGAAVVPIGGAEPDARRSRPRGCDHHQQGSRRPES